MKTVVRFLALTFLPLSTAAVFAQSTITNPPVALVTVRATDPYAMEPCSSAVPDRGWFVISRSAYTNIDMTVQIAVGGTATAGTDYVAIPSQVVIPQGRWSVEVPVTPLMDTLAEPVETVVVKVMPIACIAVYPPPPECYQVGTPAEAVVYIRQCEPPRPMVSISAPDASATEPCVPAQIDPGVFRISRTGDTNFALPVFLAIGGIASNGVDYMEITNRVTIPAGRLGLEIPVRPLQDGLQEGAESVVLRIVLPPCASEMVSPLPADCYQVGSPSEAVVYIRDCEIPRSVVSIRAVAPYTTEPCAASDAPPGRFLISRAGYTNTDLLVNIGVTGTASNGLDYAAISNAVVIPAGKAGLELPVKALADQLVEGPESVVIRILPPACVATTVWPPPPECYQIGQPADAAVYIRDCEPSRLPLVHITNPTNGQVFPVVPARIPIRVETIDPDGYCWKAEFFNGDQKIGERSKAFLVAPTNGTKIVFEFPWENVPAGIYAINVRATDNSGAVGYGGPIKVIVGPPPVTNFPPEVRITATDSIAIEGTNCWGWWNKTNPYPTVTAQTASYSPDQGCAIWWFTNCGPKNATFTIRRSGPTNEDLRVFYMIGGTATNGVDYEELPNSIVIPAGSRKAELLVVPKEDAVIERVETVVIGLIPPPYASPLPPPYRVAIPARAAAVIVDSANPRLPIGVLPDRCFYVGANAPDGSWYRVERSTNMRDWEIICTNQVVQGSVHFVDPDAPETQQRFYRAVPAPIPADSE